MILKSAVWLLGLGPVFWMGVRFATDDLGANPIEAALLLARVPWRRFRKREG